MSDDLSFQALIHKVRAGDDQAATELVRRYEPAIRRAVRIHMRNAQLRRMVDSMDICQSILASFFTRAACGAYELDQPEHLLKLLASMARHKLINEANKQKAQRRDYRRVETGRADERELAGAEGTPSRCVAAREILQRVRDQLSEEERYLADQRALNRGWVELAAELGQGPEALRKKLSRALDRVAQQLGLDEYTGDGAWA